MSLMVGTFATSPIEGDPTLALVLTLMSGLLQLLMGVLNLGVYTVVWLLDVGLCGRVAPVVVQESGGGGGSFLPLLAE